MDETDEKSTMTETDGKSLKEKFKQVTDTVQEKVQGFYGKSGKKKEQIKKLNLDLTEKDNEINNWKQKFEEADRLSQIKDAEDQKRTDLLEFEIAELKVNTEQLNEKIDILYAKVGERDATIQKLKAEGRQIQHKIEQVTKELDAKVSERDVMIQTLKIDGLQMQHRIEELTKENSAMDAEVGERDVTIQKLKVEGRRIQHQIDELTKELDATVGERDVTIQKLKLEGLQMQHRIEEVTKENVALDAKVGERDATIQKLKAEGRQMQHRIEEVTKELDATVGERDVTIQKLEADGHRMKHRIEESTKENVTLNAKVGECDVTIKKLETDGRRLQHRIEEVTKDNATINAKVGERDATIQKFEVELRRMQHRIEELTKENAGLIDPSQICRIKDVVDIYGRIDYELLNGKILWVDNFAHCGNLKLWKADGYDISCENSDFLVYPKNLCVSFHSNLSANIFNRIVCSNLKSLILSNVTVTYSDYKKLTKSQKLDYLNLFCVTVNDENGIKLEIDKLLKEANNVETLFYFFDDGEVTSETAQKLAELLPFPKLRDFSLFSVQESFDLKTFGEFLKKNPTITFCELWFKCSANFYEEIQRAQNDLLSILPSTCKLSVHKS